jgi:inner membrane protein
MDTVTHGLAGWLVAKALPSKEGRKEATAALVLGAVLPDADNVASLLGSELYLRIHRGLSHSFAGVLVTSLVVAMLIRRFGKWKDLKALYLLVLLGQLSHIALDLLNSYGTQIFLPFADTRVAFDILFIVDLAFSGIIVAGLLLSRGRPGRARAALLCLSAYVGFAVVLHDRAETAVRTAAERHGVHVVSSFALPRLGEVPSLPDMGIGRRVEAAEAKGAKPAAPVPVPGAPSQGTGIPFPVGPLAWNGFVDDGRTYLRAEVDPFTESVNWRERVPRGAAAPEVQPLLGVQDVRTYLWFARFPTVDVASADGKTVLTFTDLRFGGTSVRRPFVLRVVEVPDRPLQTRWGD